MPTRRWCLICLFIDYPGRPAKVNTLGPLRLEQRRCRPIALLQLNRHRLRSQVQLPRVADSCRLLFETHYPIVHVGLVGLDDIFIFLLLLGTMENTLLPLVLVELPLERWYSIIEDASEDQDLIIQSL